VEGYTARAIGPFQLIEEDGDETLFVFGIDKVIFPNDAMGLNWQFFEIAPHLSHLI
jgi:hypothetical protein